MVRAKFKVTKLSQTEGCKPVNNPDGTQKKDERGYGVHEPVTMVTIEMAPVYGNGNVKHENTAFWQASPSGKLELNCVNESASKQFILGKEYYVDFTPAPKS